MGMTQKLARDEEVKCFFDCFREAVEDNQKVASEMIMDFDKSRKEMLQEIQTMTDQQLLLSRIEQGSKEIRNLQDALMSLELQLVEQLEDVIKDFERNISDMVVTFTEAAQGIYPVSLIHKPDVPVCTFAQCRDLENNHNEKLLEISMVTLEKVAKNEVEEDSLDELRALLVDKDTVTGAIGASHDTHLLKIDNREDELITRINSWVAGLIKSIHHNEVTRNRKRIAEIHHYITYVQNQQDHLNPS
ncbi:hypothetical protein GJAV_G00218450 [Gymnothorax javanicus]|nr:hypothetical protein GJAV_G00218450 [Gymnothorax javanicus]